MIPNRLGIKSSVSEREVAELQRLAAGKQVVEVGALLGYSTIQLARVAKRVTSIDPHHGYPADRPSSTLMEFLHNLDRWNVAGCVTPVVDVAQNVLPRLHGFDFAFIDVTGHYDQTKYCLGHVNTPIIACHDFMRGVCNVATQAVLDYVREHGLTLRVIDTLAIIENL